MTIEQVSQVDMLSQFKERLQAIITENQKLQGAIEALEYYNPQEEETASQPPEEEETEE
jgi:hypothetical protein